MSMGDGNTEVWWQREIPPERGKPLDDQEMGDSEKLDGGGWRGGPESGTQGSVTLPSSFSFSIIHSICAKHVHWHLSKGLFCVWTQGIQEKIRHSTLPMELIFPGRRQT